MQKWFLVYALPKVHHPRVVPAFQGHFLVLVSSAIMITVVFNSSRTVQLSLWQHSQHDACWVAHHVCSLIQRSRQTPGHLVEMVFP